MLTKRNAMVNCAAGLLGCGYIYGATGWVCTQRRLSQQAEQYPQYADLIWKYGPMWMGKRCFDCAQLTRTVAKEAGVSLPSGSNSQWRASGIWQEVGTIDDLPDEGGLFLYTMSDGKMIHTGISIGSGEEIDARGHAYGVVRRRIADTSFTHWARLNIDYDASADAPNPEPQKENRRTLRKGMTGEDVRDLQTQLLMLGYSLAPYGADGSFGSVTRDAVIRFQKDHGLTADGIVGSATWRMLDSMKA